MTKRCFILVGPPAAGKSTWIKTLPGFYFDNGPRRFVKNGVVMSSDDIIEDIASDYGMSYDEAFQDLIKFADKVFWEQIERYAVHTKMDLYIDRTNMSAKSRRRYFEMLKRFDYEFHAVVFPKPDDTEWQRRLNSREGKTIPPHVLQSMIQSFQMPTLEEGFASVTVMDEFSQAA